MPLPRSTAPRTPTAGRRSPGSSDFCRSTPASTGLCCRSTRERVSRSRRACRRAHHRCDRHLSRMPRDSRIRTVVLTVRYAVRSSYYEDWLDAFTASPLFEATSFNLFHRGERRTAKRAVGNADLVVALHACSADTLEFIEPLREALKARRGRFLMLVGNEYNLPWVRLADKRRFIAETGADWVGTQLPLEAGEWLYEGTGARVLALPHAANEAVFRRDRPDEAGSNDIGR